MNDGPPFTILDARTLRDGRVRVLVRKRGGRLARVTVAAVVANGATMYDLIARILEGWPDKPGLTTTEDFNG